MMDIFLNCMAASAGGGLTYLRNVAPHLSARSGVQTTIAAPSSLKQELQHLPNVAWAELEPHHSAGRRFWQEQFMLPRAIRDCGAEVLISAGNFALWKSPVPQVLLSGNSLYTSVDFYRDLRARRDYRLWLDSHIKGIFARRSVYWADRTVTPTRAFAADLERWTGKQAVSLHHGFDAQSFCGSESSLPAGTQAKLDSGKNALRLLFVSHYNYYRNFETLLRAIPLIRERLERRSVVLYLTCRLHSKENPGAFRAETAAALVQQLGIADQVVELGQVPYNLLHHVYRAGDIYVTPAYAETFAHPVVEAMASGVPVVAADLPVHREVCGDAGTYFERFSPQELAQQVVRLANSRELSRSLADKGKIRSRDFSWARHVDEILRLAEELTQDSVKPSPQQELAA